MTMQRKNLAIRSTAIKDQTDTAEKTYGNQYRGEESLINQSLPKIELKKYLDSEDD